MGMHHKTVDAANAGDNVGMNIKGLDKTNMPRVGDVMILKSDDTIGRCKSFTAQVQVMSHPGELKVGYCPIVFVRTARSACKMTKIDWKIGKEPQQPFVVDSFKTCEGLGRVAIMEGASVIM